MKIVPYLVAVLLGIGPVGAGATLITYQIDLQLQDCEPVDSCMDHFDHDTSYSLYSRPWDITALFTVDPELLSEHDTHYDFEGPGIEMIVTIGALTLLYPTIRITTNDLWVNITGFTSAGSVGAIFPFFPSFPNDPAASVGSFLNSDMSLYRAGGLPPVVRAPNGWQLFTSGNSMSIVRVAEPGLLAQCCIGLVLIGLRTRALLVPASLRAVRPSDLEL